MEGQKQHPSVFRLPSFFALSPRFALITLLILALVGGSATTVAASDHARPGDFLFPIDIALERVQIAIANRGVRDTLRLRFAEERLLEARLALAELADPEEEEADDDETVDEIATSSDSTDDDAATTTPEEDEGGEKPKKSFSQKSIDKAANALAAALEHLERTREKLLAAGNSAAVLVLDEIIAELNELAQEHLSDLDTFEAEIKSNGDNLKIKIKASSEELETKFKFEQKGKGKTKIKFEERDGDQEDDDTEFKFELDDGEVKVKEKKKNGKTKIKIEIEEDDNNDKKGGGKGKVTLCHIPPGNPSNKHTIRVGSPAARAHLAHGDILGSCEGDGDGNGEEDDTISPIISGETAINITDTSADIEWTTNEDADSTVWYSAGALNLDNGTALKEGGGAFSTSHSLPLTGLSTSTEYRFVVVSTDASGNTATSTERAFTTEDSPADTTPPVISNLTSDAGTTTAEINWDTDENSDSTVFYGTETPLTISSTTPYTDSSDMITSHAVPLSGLTASTTYYFIVTSTDSEGNTATSTEFSFETLSDVVPEPPDTTPPVISSISASDITATSTTVSWTTDEEATSALWYDTTTPLTISTSTSMVESLSFVLNHELPLSGLTASTTYYFIVTSADSEGNTATSTEQFFSTP